MGYFRHHHERGRNERAETAKRKFWEAHGAEPPPGFSRPRGGFSAALYAHRFDEPAPRA